MRSLRLFLIGWLLLACGTALSAGAPLDDSKESRAAKRAVQVQLRSRFTLDRTAAVRRIADFPAMEGSRLILQVGLSDPEPEVRRAAYETLLTWKDDREVCNHLLKSLEKDIRGKNGPSAATPILAVLLASELPEIQRHLSKFLENSLAKSKDGIFLVGAVIDQLGMQGDAAALAPLQRLLQQKCILETFACRRAVIQAMIRIRKPETITALIGLLPRLDGEVRGDVVRHFEEISGQQLGTDAKAWQAWWKEKADGFEFPANPGGLPLEGVTPGVASYYGLALYAKRIVFVIDTSASMAGRRLLAAKRELTAAVNGLPNDVEVGIVAFQSQVTMWRPTLVPATPAAKQDANYYIYNLVAGGKTATYDALDKAFHLDPEAVYLLSDGEPTLGRIVAPAGIVHSVTSANRSRRISINTIGIAPGPPGSPMELFMKTLADQNFGRFRRVDE